MTRNRSPRPIVIGVLGGIASGKSRVARMLEARGALRLDADVFAHAALADPAVVAALEARHGTALLVPGSMPSERRVDRQFLANRVFGPDADPTDRRHLEALVHPRVREALGRSLDRALADHSHPAVVLDVPLLLEATGFVDRCDLLWFVDAPLSQREERALHTRGWPATELARRELHQTPLADKRLRADLVLLNDRDEPYLEAQVAEWLDHAGGFAGLPRKSGAPGAPR